MACTQSHWRTGSRIRRSIMSWLKWILAYLFDCVHPHTTWPHRDRVGLAYVCCIDCGRELPYSVQQMKIVTRQEQLQDLTQTVGANVRPVRTSANLRFSRTRSGVVTDASSSIWNMSPLVHNPPGLTLHVESSTQQ